LPLVMAMMRAPAGLTGCGTGPLVDGMEGGDCASLINCFQ